ncbi:hypothetical protein C8F01DRAFT_292280 [Mycena amicta]|nr:hypothetical protein C8F01DRAFT_292280 [Mycena amicta]
MPALPATAPSVPNFVLPALVLGFGAALFCAGAYLVISALAKRVGDCVTDVENSGTAEFSIVDVPSKTDLENSEFSVVAVIPKIAVEVPKTAPVIVHPIVAAIKTSTSVQPTTFVLKRKSWTPPGSSPLVASTVTAPIAQLPHLAVVAVKSSGSLVQPTVAVHSRRKWTAPRPSPLVNSFSLVPEQASSLFAVTSIFVAAPAIIIHSPRPVHAYKPNVVPAFVASLPAEVPPPVYVPNFEEADRQRDKFLALYAKAVQLGIITDCSNKPLAGMKGTWKDEPFAKRVRPTAIKATGSRAVSTFDKENAHTLAAPLAKPKRASGQVWWL